MPRLTTRLATRLLLAPILAIPLAIPASAEGQAPRPAQNGNLFVAQTIKILEQHASITAKLRYQSRLHQQTLAGAGNYWQQLRPHGKRVMRWEMQTPIADQTASFLQVYDGNHLWTDRRLPSGRQVRRLDVPWLQTRLRTDSRGAPTDELKKLLAAVEGQGGLAQMLADLLRNYHFQAPQPTQLNGLPVSALIGHWRPEQLASLWPEAAKLQSDTPPEWPDHLPHHVLLLVGKNRFPYVCEHRRAADAPLATSLAVLRPSSDPLLRYEVFEVKFAEALNKKLFEFLPGDIQWSDESALVLEQLTQLSATQQ